MPKYSSELAVKITFEAEYCFSTVVTTEPLHEVCAA
jgi:hypothetical protein